MPLLLARLERRGCTFVTLDEARRAAAQAR